MTAGGIRAGDGIGHDTATAAIAAVAGRATGPVGLAARHLESGETLSWHAGERFSTASMIKVAIHAAVLRRARADEFSLDDQAELTAGDLTGGSGVLSVLRPGLRCTVSDLCTLMIVVSDNTATNMLIDMCGGAEAINDDFAALGFPGFRLNRRIGIPPPPLTRDDRESGERPGTTRPGTTGPRTTGPGTAPPGETTPPDGPLATVTLTDFCELMTRLHAGTVVSEEASAEIIAVLRHQQHQVQFPRAYLGIASPGDPPGPDGPAMAHKTGSTSGCRTEAGLLYLPEGGGTVAYAAAAGLLADRTMTALAEGNEILGLLGAIVLARWWAGPGPVPVRDGWLPAGSGWPRSPAPPPGHGGRDTR